MKNRTDILPVEAYTSNEWFKLELKHIFSTTWQFAGLVEDVSKPGDYITVQAGLNNIFVMMGHDHNVRAFHNICRHRGTQLLQSVGKSQKAITCPYHDWVYDIDGNLISIPEQQTEFPDLKTPLRDCGLNLHHASVGIFKGMLFVHPDAQPETSLEEYFAEVQPFLGPHKVESLVEYTEEDGQPLYSKVIHANWKIIVDNYIDHYHLSHLHKNTLDMYDHKNARFGWAGPHYWFYESLIPAYEKDVENLSPYVLIDSVPENQMGAYVPWFFPNIGISESESTWSTFHVLPLAPNKTLVTIRTKVMDVSEAKAAKQYLKSGLHSFWKKYENKFSEDDPEPMKSGDFMQEDIYACEQLQKSLQSPYYSVGAIAQKGEYAIVKFQHLIREWLDKYS
ncbi:aromatic ring-hydroxylating dioxygenase subunit alpha [bacterium SCSIO 12643]|nr:aromatic ring-hydroxylating dioxygenase subunit alpha [bacterium SCSIO 12643]